MHARQGGWKVSRYALGIDIGTTSVKAILISLDGRIVYETSAPHDLHSEHIGWAEEDTEDWWSNTRLVVKRMIGDVPDAVARIEAIGVSGMVPAIVLLDADGRPLRRSIQQNDARSGKEIEWLRRTLDQDELYRLTGGFTNQQHVLPRLLWIKDNEPELWGKVSAVVGSYDYITYRLTGRTSIEVNWAAESGLYDIREGAWLTEQMKGFNIDPAIFPDVPASADGVGTV